MNFAIVLLLILLNGLFAMAEMAVVSSSKLRLQQLAKGGDAAAQRALSLAESPNRFLATVQVGITLVGVFAGAFGGATLAEPVARAMRGIPYLASIADPLSFALVVVAITYLSLVVGELVPKRVALNDPEGIAVALARFMHGLSVAAGPLVRFLGASTEAVLWMLRVRPREEEEISEEEIGMIISQGRRAGVVEPAEEEIIENAFWLGERRVTAIMTPRHVVRWLDVKATPEEILSVIRASPHRRYLVADGNLDRVAGFVTSDGLLGDLLERGGFELATHLKKPLVVPETLPILALLERFKESGTHLAVVVDEYGSFEGLVTLSDILEELVGEVKPPGAGEAPEKIETGEGEWLVSGALHVDELLSLLSLQDRVDLSGEGYQTVGGLVGDRLGRVPQKGDSFRWHNFGFRVEKMSGLRVEQVSVKRERKGA